MKEIFKDEVVINGSVNDVWSYFIDIEQNGPKWMPGISSISVENKKLSEGNKITFTTRGKQQSSTVTSYKENDYITLTSVQGNFKADYRYSFNKHNENQTSLLLHATCEAEGIYKLLSPLIRLAIKKADGNQLKQFKEAFEMQMKNRPML
ncbi:hypothetical protein CIB95_15525 [Lottiidibacillus patelloidae]|uniref:Polyketide cyclase n=1 Tax=Lottiidibacillus patelloidae TaxID=2670334 RepID=A0A263BPU0_9BACI|nr:hypothetical protein [Lottiidibacillus patelloidae]OZM55771.1 hypothetical protein CIB95_15525 [Lottiidibacillus patelloidae]